MIRASIGVALASALVVAAAAVAPAHTGGTTGYASITVERGTVRYRLTLPASALPTDLADALRLARDGSARSREQLIDLLRTRIVLHAGSTRCEPGPGSLERAPFDSPTVTMSVDFACGSPVEELAVQDDAGRQLGPDGVQHLGEVPVERLQVPRAQQDLVAVPEDDAPEAVPLGLVEPGGPGSLLLGLVGDGRLRLGQHGLQGRHHRQLHAHHPPPTRRDHAR